MVPGGALMSQPLIFKRITSLLSFRFGALFAAALTFVSVSLAGWAHCAQGTVAWDPASTQVTGYKLYYGLSTRNYSSSIDAGKSTSSTLQGVSNPTDFLDATA